MDELLENNSNYTTEGVAEYVMTLFSKSFKGVCIDIGAYDPFWLSNSWLFEKKGWNTYCIEPNPSCILRLKKYRKNVLEYACADENRENVDFYIYTFPTTGPNLFGENTWTGEAAATGLILHRRYDSHKKIKVNVRTLDWLMENEIKQDHIDYLSIDVERNELSTLRGIDLFRWKPKVIVIENIDKEPVQYAYLKDMSYRYVHRILVNDFYISNEYYSTFIEKRNLSK